MNADVLYQFGLVGLTTEKDLMTAGISFSMGDAVVNETKYRFWLQGNTVSIMTGRVGCKNLTVVHTIAVETAGNRKKNTSNAIRKAILYILNHLIA